MQRRSTETADPANLETLDQFRERMKREGKTFKPRKRRQGRSHVRHGGTR